jgi:hypothetical protein
MITGGFIIMFIPRSFNGLRNFNKNLYNVKDAIKNKNYNKFEKNYKELSLEKRESLKLNYLDKTYRDYTECFRREGKLFSMEIWFVCIGIVIFVLVLIGIALCMMIPEECEFPFLVELKQLPFPKNIDDPPLDKNTTKYLANYFYFDTNCSGPKCLFYFFTFIIRQSNAFFYTIFIPEYYDYYHKVKRGTECAAIKHLNTADWINYEIEKMLCKQDYYLQLSGPENFRGKMTNEYDQLLILDYLNLIEGCYLATRDSIYSDVLKKFVESNDLSIREKAIKSCVEMQIEFDNEFIQHDCVGNYK